MASDFQDVEAKRTVGRELGDVREARVVDRCPLRGVGVCRKQLHRHLALVHLLLDDEADGGVRLVPRIVVIDELLRLGLDVGDRPKIVLVLVRLVELGASCCREHRVDAQSVLEFSNALFGVHVLQHDAFVVGCEPRLRPEGVDGDFLDSRAGSQELDNTVDGSAVIRAGRLSGSRVGGRRTGRRRARGSGRSCLPVILSTLLVQVFAAASLSLLESSGRQEAFAISLRIPAKSHERLDVA